MIEIPLEGDRILVLDNSTNVKVNGMLRKAFRLHDKLVLSGSQAEDTEYLELPVCYLGGNSYIGKCGDHYVAFEV